MIVIYSDEHLADAEVEQVRDILKHSQCPNESLSNTFPRYRTLEQSADGKVFRVYFDSEKITDATCSVYL